MAGNFDTSGTQSSPKNNHVFWAVGQLCFDSVYLKGHSGKHRKWNASSQQITDPFIWQLECLHIGWFLSSSFHFPCCHYPHVSCWRRLDGLNVSERLVLTSVSLQDSPQYSSGLSALRLWASFSLWWSVGDFFLFWYSYRFPFPHLIGA